MRPFAANASDAPTAREDEFWRALSSSLLERGPELSAALREHASTGRELVEVLVDRGLISADDLYEAVILSRAQPPQSCLYMLPSGGKHALVERDGPAPASGERIDVDGRCFVVTRVGSSPLPNDARPCVFLARS